jgi:hypothetical protein
LHYILLLPSIYLINKHSICCPNNESPRFILFWFTYNIFIYSDYIKILSTSNPGSALFNPGGGVYNFQRPLNKTYENVTSVLPILSSYQSTVNDYVGYTVESSMNTSTSVNIKFTVVQNSSFSLLGFHIVIIAKPFDLIFKYSIIDVNVNNQLVKKSFIVPTSYQNYIYLISSETRRNNNAHLVTYSSIYINSTSN